MAKHRLGVVLLLPPPVSFEVDGLRRALGDGALGRVPPHITLVPPVNVRADRLDEALAVLRAGAAATRPFHLLLNRPASFLPDNPVLFLEVGGDVTELRALRDRVFRGPLDRPLTWPFVPHVTLADDAPPERIHAALAALADYRASITLERVHLLEEGPDRVWSVVADAAFETPAVIGRGGLPIELTVSERLAPDAERWAAAEWPEIETAEGPLAITARRDGEIVGVARGRIEGDRAHLSELLVGAAHRGEGIGSHLLAAFEWRAAQAGCRAVTLRTEAGGRSEAFYVARGWYPEAHLPGFRRGVDFVQLIRATDSRGTSR
jgi:2'-5' RNA ligase